MKTPIVTIILLVLFCFSASLQAQDTIRVMRYRHYKESVITLGYNFNFGDKEENGKRPEPWHFVELGWWKSNVYLGHHAFMTNYYFANDFGLNTNDFMIGPKAGCFAGFYILGLGAELVYYTDFDSGSLRFIPSFGMFTPWFKLTINPHLIITNKEFQDLHKVHVNLTMPVFRGKRNDLTNPRPGR